MNALVIDGVELRLVRLPLQEPFRIATGTQHDKTFPLLTLRSNGLEGYAEGVMDPLPDYLEETIAGAVELLERALVPQFVGGSFENPAAVEHVLAPWRGHRMTKAMVEMAFWDLWAKKLGLPLRVLLGGTSNRVPVGVSLGIDDVEVTVERARAYHEEGYRRIKLKIMPGHDLALLRAVRKALPDAVLSVDANASYSLGDLETLRELDHFRLDYIEQPLAYDDLQDHATLQRHLATSICLDESLRSAVDARKALQLDAARIINIKVGRVGGYQEARRIHDLCAAWGIPVWCGGMLEAGVGRAHNLHLSTLPNFRKPGDTSSASRYFAQDIVTRPLEAESGCMTVPDGPGIGVELDRGALDAATVSVREFSR